MNKECLMSKIKEIQSKVSAVKVRISQNDMSESEAFADMISAVASMYQALAGEIRLDNTLENTNREFDINEIDEEK